MKVFKKILFVVLGSIVLLLVSGLFMRKDYAIEREVVINQPTDSVFNYLKLLKNQEKFASWFTLEPDMKKSFSGTDGTVGATLSWESDNMQVGVGGQEIVKITPGKRLDFELRFTAPLEAKDDAYFITEPISEHATKVKWGFSGHMDYPANMMLTLLNADEQLSNDLQKGLDVLKVILEEK